jgi:hypothetical protein
MTKITEAEALIEMHSILSEEISIEFKCERIMKDVIKKLLDEQKAEYERLFFSIDADSN